MIITGCVNRDRSQQRMAGSSGVFPEGISWIYSRVTIMLGRACFFGWHNYLFRERKGAHTAHSDLSVQTNAQNHSGWEERKQVFYILQDNLIGVISAVRINRGLLWSLCSSFQLQGIALDDYKLCWPRISLCSLPALCWEVLAAEFCLQLPHPQIHTKPRLRLSEPYNQTVKLRI